MSEAKGDIVMTQTMLLFKFKLLCYHANKILVSIPTWSTSATLQIKGLATKYPTVKWPIAQFQFEFLMTYINEGHQDYETGCMPLYFSWTQIY